MGTRSPCALQLCVRVWVLPSSRLGPQKLYERRSEMVARPRHSVSRPFMPASVATSVSPRRRPPCRRERSFDLNGACKSAAKSRGSQ